MQFYKLNPIRRECYNAAEIRRQHLNEIAENHRDKDYDIELVTTVDGKYALTKHHDRIYLSEIDVRDPDQFVVTDDDGNICFYSDLPNRPRIYKNEEIITKPIYITDNSKYIYDSIKGTISLKKYPDMILQMDIPKNISANGTKREPYYPSTISPPLQTMYNGQTGLIEKLRSIPVRVVREKDVVIDDSCLWIIDDIDDINDMLRKGRK